MKALFAFAAAALWHLSSGQSVTTDSYTYGKYYAKNPRTGQKDTSDQMFWLFRPASSSSDSPAAKLPVVVEFHGGGFTGGSATKTPNAMISSAVANGIAWISVNYRLVATKYYYGGAADAGTDADADAAKVEELIHVDASGRLTLDTTGKTMDDYEVRRGRTEFNTKCSFDAAQFIEYLIAHADALGIDVHRIATTGGSAGGGEIHYLTWVYHQLAGVGRYTPRGMVYTMAQLDYPVQNILDRVWSLWVDDVGADVKLSTILSYGDCGMIIGNPWCAEPGLSQAQYSLCNATWQAESMGRFCATEAAFDRATLGEVMEAQVWPRDDPAVGAGMEKLWYNSLNMQRHQPSKPFYLYVANRLNSTAGMNVVHNALYARNYARFAEEAGVQYTVYYTDYEAMTKNDTGTQRFAVPDSGGHGGGGGGTVVWNYRSSHDWIDRPGVKNATARASSEEQLLYFCLALGVEGCTVSPGPSPGPSPAPLSKACKQLIDADCPAQRSQAACGSCVRSNARALQAGGCPPARQGGFQSCLDYCMSRSTTPASTISQRQRASPTAASTGLPFARAPPRALPPPPCSLNGDLDVHGACECDPGWVGDECQRLDLLPADPAAGLQAKGSFSSWGGSVLREDHPSHQEEEEEEEEEEADHRSDRPSDQSSSSSSSGSNSSSGTTTTTTTTTPTYHMFAAVMEHGCGLNAWRPNSAIGHATSRTGPAGPYQLQKIIKPHFAHSPEAVRAADGSWLIYHVGAGANDTRPCADPKSAQCQFATNCSGGCTGPAHPWMSGLSFYGPSSVLRAASPFGPWTDTVIGACKDVPGCEPGSRGKGYPGNGNDMNPAPLVDPEDGSVLMLWRSINYTKGSGQSYYASASAPAWDGGSAGFKWSTDNLFPDFSWCHIEDGFLYRNARGLHALFHSDCEKTSGGAAGGHAYSNDGGKSWHFHPQNAYHNNITLSGGRGAWSLNRRERPKLILDSHGHITHLVNGVSLPGEANGCGPHPSQPFRGGGDHTFTFIQPVRTAATVAAAPAAATAGATDS
eukprot:g645.t1